MKYGVNLNTSLADRMPVFTLPKRGPSKWLAIKDDPEQYGPEHDYTVTEQGSYVIFQPVSNAAIEWSRFTLPEWLTRWRATGYKIDKHEFVHVERRARMDNLTSRVEYEARMNENEQLNQQQHDQP